MCLWIEIAIQLSHIHNHLLLCGSCREANFAVSELYDE